ncbi:MAG: hypothetical protein J6T94_08110 [Bacteroidaceae bacterium]|nr:hypothetical protein [Bacteroidaceae bacterium]
MLPDKIYNFLSEYGIDISESHGAFQLYDRRLEEDPSIRYNLKEYPSYYWCLDNTHIYDFIALCYEEKTPIIGIQIIVKKKGDYNLSWDVWCYERKDGENIDSYLMNSIKGAVEYTKYFIRKKDRFFEFTLDLDDLE